MITFSHHIYMEDIHMSKHKLIMESWRKFLAEGDRGYRTTTPEGDDIYLYHKTMGPTGTNNRIVLYTIDPDAFFIPPGGEVNMEELLNGQKDIGSIFIFPASNREPCIPETYQVGAVHTAPDFDGQGYGTLLYDLAFLLAGSNGWGLTSDRDTGTKTTARGIWASIEANDAKYQKRKTEEIPISDVDLDYIHPQPEEGATSIGGNDTFDYSGRTPDPEDDCTRDYEGRNTATNHSFVMKDLTEIKGVYDELKNNHEQLVKLMDEYDESYDPNLNEPGDHGEIATEFLGMIRDRSSDNFGDRYDQADE